MGILRRITMWAAKQYDEYDAFIASMTRQEQLIEMTDYLKSHLGEMGDQEAACVEKIKKLDDELESTDWHIRLKRKRNPLDTRPAI